MTRCTLLVNFGGPRNLKEVESFLAALLTDKDVIRTKFPRIIHNLLFTRIAKKRALKVSLDYESIGGKSPIYEDTEKLAEILREEKTILTFHRYLPSTHELFIKKITTSSFEEIDVFPLFPQFTYATTGSIARWFSSHLPSSIVSKMRWIKSYPDHPLFVLAHRAHLLDFLKMHDLKEEETFFLFSAHGLPKTFVQEGDPYEEECRASFQAIMHYFPKTEGLLAFQSKFGKGEWLRPYMSELSLDILKLTNKKNLIIIPISFTSDHIETLFEIEQEYLIPIRNQGIQALRVPALTLKKEWILAIKGILEQSGRCNTHDLVRKYTHVNW